MVDGGMAALGVVETFDEVEHRQAGLDLGLEADAVEEFALEGGEETLAQGIVEAVTNRAHGGAHMRLAAYTTAIRPPVPRTFGH
jgi:hypothetical protein